MNCNDKGVITIRNRNDFGVAINYRKDWCNCTKGQFLKKESNRNIKEEM